MENAKPPVQAPPPHIVTKTRSRLPFVIAFLIILFLIPTAVFVYSKVTKNEPLPNPTPIVFSTPTPSPSASLSGNLETYQSEKLDGISFSAFSLNYPKDWTLEEEKGESGETLSVNIAKGEYAIVIQQGPFDGGGCIYEGSVPEGPYSDKRNKEYTDLETAIGTLRRNEEKAQNGELGYAFCQENEDGDFGTLTSVGAISYGGPETWQDGTLEEMDEIIKSIKEI